MLRSYSPLLIGNDFEPRLKQKLQLNHKPTNSFYMKKMIPHGRLELLFVSGSSRRFIDLNSRLGDTFRLSGESSRGGRCLRSADREMFEMFKTMRCVLSVCLLALVSSGVLAETWPSRVVRIVVPTAAGSSVDIVARLVGEKLGPMLGQAVIVENKPGANGTIGVDAVVNARDAHTLLLGYNGPLTVSPSLSPKPPYNVARDLVPIILAVTQPNVLAVRADLKVNSLKELLALAKSKPGTLDYASVGIGSLSNLSMELLKMHSGAYMVHIPYNGGPPTR